MEWSPQQDAALRSISEWISAPGDRQVFRLDGYAGTGKTTIAVHAAQSLDGDVLFAAPTGKAAHVMRRKGCVGAGTIHQLIYHTKDKSRARLRSLEIDLTRLIDAIIEDGQESIIDDHPDVVALRDLISRERRDLSQPFFTLDEESKLRDASLLVLDEASMIDARVGQDLLTFGVPVIVIGDPAQLPPVKGDSFFFRDSDRRADVTLTEIHRQALDNPIIAMATQIRGEEAPAAGTYGESRVIDKEDITAEMALATDQIIVGRNRTRHAYNRRIRSLMGMADDLPLVGDRLVCLRNSHDLGLYNGSTWDVRDCGEGSSGDRLHLTAESTDDPDLVVECEAHRAPFIGEQVEWYERKEAQEFDYGYAMTGHKSQGSQWDDVLVVDESWCFRADRWKWLYTAVTRAAERVVVAR